MGSKVADQQSVVSCWYDWTNENPGSGLEEMKGVTGVCRDSRNNLRHGIGGDFKSGGECRIWRCIED